MQKKIKKIVKKLTTFFISYVRYKMIIKYLEM